MGDRLALVLVEYRDGRVAMQVLKEDADALFDECRHVPDTVKRMSLINIEFRDGEIVASGRQKNLRNSEKTT